MNRKALSSAVFLALGVLMFQVPEPAAAAQPTVFVFGPGGPLPAMKQAAAVFGKTHHVDVMVTGGPTPAWLAEIPNIVGLKDATGDIGRGVMLMRSLPVDFEIYSRDDPTAAALMLYGAHRNISVTANVIPTLMSRLCVAARSGDLATVRAISHRIAPLHEAMFVDSNPIPVK